MSVERFLRRLEKKTAPKSPAELLKQTPSQEHFDAELERISGSMGPLEFKRLCADMAQQARDYYNNVNYQGGNMELPSLLPDFLSHAEPDQILAFAKGLNDKSSVLNFPERRQQQASA